MNQNVKKITEGAMMCALVGMVLFFNRQTAGMLEYLFYWLLVFPILIYTVKYGFKAALVPSVCMLLLSVMLSAPTTIFYLCSSLIIGLFYGVGVKKHLENKILLGVTIFFTLISYIITTILFAQLFGFGGDDLEMTMEVLDMLHISLPYRIKDIALAISIFLAILMSVLEGTCIHLIAIILLKRLKIAEIRVKSIFDMQLPKWFGWISIVVILLFWGRNVVSLGHEGLTVLIGAYACVMVIGLGNGCLYLMCALLLSGKRRWVWVLPILVMIPIVQYLILFVGLYDMVTNGKQVLKEAFLNGTIRELKGTNHNSNHR